MLGSTGTEGEFRTRLVPTWQLSPGSSTQSLAMEVAVQQGIPKEVVQRAQQHLQCLWAGERQAVAPPSNVDEGDSNSSSGDSCSECRQ